MEATVEALVFYLSIRKASSTDSSPRSTPAASPAYTSLSLPPSVLPSSPSIPSSLPTKPKSWRRRLGDRIIVSLSDPRALQQVERALQAARSLSAGDARGRMLKGERSVSASREARQTGSRSSVKATSGRVPRAEVKGLQMEMGEPTNRREEGDAG